MNPRGPSPYAGVLPPWLRERLVEAATDPATAAPPTHNPTFRDVSRERVMAIDAVVAEARLYHPTYFKQEPQSCE